MFLYAVRIDNDRTRAFYINLTSEFEPRGPGVRITKAACPVVQMAPCLEQLYADVANVSYYFIGRMIQSLVG
jgi:hypothetical protein